jgi:hypothetical protein
LRKSFLVAATAALAFGVTGVAQAQNPAPSIDVTSSVSPSKAGTKSKPKSERFKLEVTNDPNSKATASKIEVTMPSTLKLSTSGLDQCRASDEDLVQNGPQAECRRSIAGSGEARALLNPFAATPAPLVFKVTPIIGRNELLFHLQQTNGAVRAVLHGKISGRKMTITIPEFLQMPAAGTYSALQGLETSLSKKKGSKYLISSNGCKSRAHKVGVKVTYVPNPSPPAATTASGTGNARCS